MNSNAPIGIFDSGVGGSSIWKEIHQLMPNENTLYLADSKNAPYGHKSELEIIDLSIKNTNFLLEQGCKIIVVACNTATTNAIGVLRSHYDTPIIGIEPAIKPAALKSSSKSIGILATKGTLSSKLFHETSDKFTNGIQITEVIGEGLVPLIEAGKTDGPEIHSLLERYIQPMLEADIDYLVLGCSHYPYLLPELESMLPPHIHIIDSGLAVAKQTKAVLSAARLLNRDIKIPSLRFFTNTETTTLELLLKEYEGEISIAAKEF